MMKNKIPYIGGALVIIISITLTYIIGDITHTEINWTRITDDYVNCIKTTDTPRSGAINCNAGEFVVVNGNQYMCYICSGVMTNYTCNASSVMLYS